MVGGTVVSTVASQQKGPGFNNWINCGTFLCGHSPTATLDWIKQYRTNE